MKPTRKHKLTLTIEADTELDLVSSLKQVIHDINISNLRNGVSCGVNSSTSYKYVVDPNMTHEQYIKDLDEYIKQQE